MNTQPEALRLADALDFGDSISVKTNADNAAAELRRLHAVNAELLEALKLSQVQIENQCDVGVDEWIACREKISAAITKAEGQQ